MKTLFALLSGALACSLIACVAAPSSRDGAAPPAVAESAPSAAERGGGAAAVPGSERDSAVAAVACGPGLSPAETRRLLGELGREALVAIERGDSAGLVRLGMAGRGLDVGRFGSVSHRVDVRAAFHDGAARSWNGRSNSGDGPVSASYRDFFAELGRARYSRADLVGYGEVAQEDSLCGSPCVAEEIAAAFPCSPFIQYAYATGSAANPGMWHFVVVAFDRDAAGWHVVGLLEDQWSP